MSLWLNTHQLVFKGASNSVYFVLALILAASVVCHSILLYLAMSPLTAEIVAAVNSPEVRQKLQELGAEARPSTIKEARDLMTSEIARWKSVIETAKIERQ